MLAYLAHPIDFVDLGLPSYLNEEVLPSIIRDLKSEGISVYCPSNAFEVAQVAPEPFVGQINNYALDQADMVVVVWPEAKTIGTVLELARAIEADKPVVVVSEAAMTSWSLAGITAPNVYITNAFGGDEVEWLTEMCRAKPVSRETRLPLKFSFNTPDAYLCNWAPQQSYTGDAGFDLFVSEDTEIPVGQFRDVPCGISVELPEGVWGMITGRSSTLRMHNLMVPPAIIDQGYRGPLYAGVYNMNGEQFCAKKGMRLAQLIPFPLVAAQLFPTRVAELSPSVRGEQGFGSSGQ